jgi:poly(3-hydroxybutyrate) depolymerase
MLYHWYELGHAAVSPARAVADAGRLFFNNPCNPLTHTPFGRHVAAACEVFESATRRRGKPKFQIASTTVDGRAVAVHENVVWQRPFCRLINFVRELPAPRAARDPRILLVAPMSGHFATLLRGTVEALLPDHDVYITDWQDARHVPLSKGRFNLDDYIVYMIDLFRHFGGDVHVFAVCQPSVPVLAAAALMEENDDPSVPLSLVLAGGPVDTRIGPTLVNRLAEQRGTAWFRRNVISKVPWPNRGFGRSVYPGFLQLTGFMTMNLDRHIGAHRDLFDHLVRGDGDSAAKHRKFYDEYLAVMDLTAEFYLQTIDTVFVRHALPKGEMIHGGRRVDLKAIHRIFLMTIEGEKDDITGLGQCAAALELCCNIPAANKQHFQCPGVGHYGIFNGSRFRTLIAPRIAKFVRKCDPRSHAARTFGDVDRKVRASNLSSRSIRVQRVQTAGGSRAELDSGPAMQFMSRRSRLPRRAASTVQRRGS